MKKYIITILATSFLATSAFAGQIGMGVTGSIAAIAAEGKEADIAGTADTSGRTATASNNAMIGSIFAEYTLDNGFTLGVDYIPGSADVSSSAISDEKLTVDGNEATQQDGTNTAQAEIENHITYYAELPLHNGVYVKGGYVEMDVNTLESSTYAAATYGNTTVDGLLFGVGYKTTVGSGNAFYKIEGSHTEFDTLSITGSTTDKGNKISADLDVTKLTFALGFAF
tara:strand:- start:777 stop:1454 length:678 start_codon:yes stop_codon:yes gene_type:complete